METGNDPTIEACWSVLAEVLTVLGKHRRHLVIVGGWVPPILFGRGDHIGSIDVDLAINSRTLPVYVYETIKNELETQGYFRTSPDPENRYYRTVRHGGREQKIKIDLITADDAHPATERYRHIHGMTVWCAPGVEVAFQDCVEREISAVLPAGGRNTIRAQVATAGALVVMKGMALAERLKKKDAYDIYYCLAHHPRGIDGLAAELRTLTAFPVCSEALRRICEKFSTIDAIGPDWAAQIVGAAGGNYESARRDAFERAQALLQALGTGLLAQAPESDLSL